MKFLKKLLTNESHKVSNPRLLKAIMAISNEENPQNRDRLYKEILRSSFLVPIQGFNRTNRTGKWVSLNEAQEFDFVTCRDDRGQPGLMVFSDIEALQLWKRKDCGYIGMKAIDLFSLALIHGVPSIIINVAGPFGGIITRREFGVLAEGGIPQGDVLAADVSKVVFPKAALSLIGPPKNEPPQELIAQLHDMFVIQKEIEAAYFYTTVIGKGTAHNVIGIRLDHSLVPGIEKRIIDEALEKIGDWIGQGEYIDLMILEGKDLLQVVKENGYLIYKRGDK